MLNHIAHVRTATVALGSQKVVKPQAYILDLWQTFLIAFICKKITETSESLSNSDYTIHHFLVLSEHK